MTYSYKYPRAALAADCVVFGEEARTWKVLLVRRAHPPFQSSWALPGGFVELDETLEQAARRELKEETGLDLRDLPVEQLGAFDAIDRDPRERVISVVHVARVRVSEHRIEAADDAAEVAWFALDGLPELAFDHAHVLACARQRHEATL